MDASGFLRERTKFIRFYYSEGRKPFAEVQRLIEEQLHPYNVPPPDFDPSDAEPAFYDEWEAADTARDVLAMSCVSLLSESLKLYFNSLQNLVIGFEFQSSKEEGFVPAYKRILGQILDTDWVDCPADFGVIEQIVLARNRVQHNDNLYMLPPTHDAKTLGKYPRPFFANDDEIASWSQYGDPPSFLAPSVKVTQEQLFSAIENVEKLALYVDSRMYKAWEWRAGQKSSGDDA